MNFFDAIQSENVLINFNTRNKFLNNFYDIDSFNLLLGRNGTGKTRFFKRIIDFYGNEILNTYYISNNGSALNSIANLDLHIIYYTPGKSSFPSRHQLKHFTDASKIGGAPSTEIYYRIQALLGGLENFHYKIESDKKEILLIINEALTTIRSGMNTGATFENPELINLSHKYHESKNNAYKKLTIGLDAINYFASKIKDRLIEVENETRLTLPIYFALLVKESKEYGYAHSAKILIDDTGVMKKNFTTPSELLSKAKFEADSIAHYVRLDYSSYSPIRIELHSTEELSKMEFFSRQTESYSSGEKAILSQVYKIHQAIKKAAQTGYRNILLLIDEGDAFLHADWQVKYLALLNDFLGELKIKFEFTSIQVILASHSPILATDFPSEFITNLDGGWPSSKEGEALTFATPIEFLLLKQFGTSPVGSFAERKINKICNSLNAGGDVTDARELVKIIGDEYIRGAIDSFVSKKIEAGNHDR